MKDLITTTQLVINSDKIGQKWINTCFFRRDIIKFHTEK